MRRAFATKAAKQGFLSLTFCSLLTDLKRPPSQSFITDVNLTLLQGGKSYQLPRKFSTSAALNLVQVHF